LIDLLLCTAQNNAKIKAFQEFAKRNKLQLTHLGKFAMIDFNKPVVHQ